MDIIKRITKNLKIILKNKTEEEAIENVLYAKLSHLYSLKNIKFTSINNFKMPSTVAYFAVNFVNSGGAKNILVNTLDDLLLPFVNDEYKRLDLEIANELKKEEIDLLDDGDKSYQKEKKYIEKKYDKGGVITFKTNGGTTAALYDKLEKIEKYKKGAIFTQITEFADYFKTSVDDNRGSNKSFLDSLNNLYDGLFEPNDSVGTKRHEIKGVPFSLLFMSDFEELQEQKNNDVFKRRLKTGFARRMCFYINKGINYSKNPPKRPDIEEMKQSYEELRCCSMLIRQSYDNLMKNSVFIFDNDANKMIENWEDNVAYHLKDFYKYDIPLTKDEIIKKIELEGSTWKIIKIAVIMQILKNENTVTVSKDSVIEAIKWYEKCQKCLYQILDEKQITPEDELLGYIINNQNRIIKRNELRTRKFVSPSLFTKWINVALEEIQESLNERGLELVKPKQNANSQGIICQKIENEIPNKVIFIKNSNNNKLNDETLFTEYGNTILKANEIKSGTRDIALTYTVGILINAVNNGDISHNKAMQWLDIKLNEVTTKDFEENAKKFRKKLKELRF